MIEEPIKYITKVEISGLWDRYDIEWNLHPDVNVLAGINGSGKTTILNCIHELISGGSIPENRLKKVKKINLTFNDGFNISHSTTEKNNVTHNYNAEGKWVSTHFRADVMVLPMTSNLINTFDAKLKPQELLQKVDNNTTTELDFELWQLQKEYLNYQVNLGKKLKANKGNPDDNSTYFQDKFLEIIDNLFSETHKKVNRDKNELEFLLGDTEINAYQLSSGEKQLLVILLTVLVQDNKPSILLMDEPEISLHLDWQENLINYIRELNPNAQLIIATHSPGLIMGGWFDKVFELSDLTVKDRLAS